MKNLNSQRRKKCLKKSKTDKAIDDISGSTTRNERAWAIGVGVPSAVVGGFFGGTAGAAAGGLLGARLGSAAGHGAQQVEKSVHDAGKEISKLNPFKKK